MAAAVLTFEDLRNRVVDDGIAEVKVAYADDASKREGAIEGFELARSLTTREEFEKVLHARSRRELNMQRAYYERRGSDGATSPAALEQYWFHRYATLQVEWVLACLLVAGWSRPGDMLSGRAARKVAEVTRC